MMKSPMDSQKSFRCLAESIRSLLGFKTGITSTSWVDSSVCNNINISTLPSDPEPLLDNRHDNLNGSDDEDRGNAASKIKDDLGVLTAIITQLNIQRRQVLNELLDLKGNIRVFCRVRPSTETERDKFSSQKPVVAGDSDNVLIKFAQNKSKVFSFDKVFKPSSSQDEVFVEVEPVLKSALDGYNACILAYGQTGAGKTFTMEGTADFPGIVPRSIEALFKQADESNHKFLFTFSMLEIYLGHLRDLLIPRIGNTTNPLPPCLSIQTSPNGEIEIENLVTININDLKQAMKLYRLGCRFRSTGSTESNKTSSRSHCMIRISMSCFGATERRRLINKLWLVDLGGSERVLKTKARGRRFDEGKAINLSLSALGDVIHALQTKMCHIPYRNSKLTQVLQDSLGEDSKTLMLVHVSPREEDLCETISSLSFATRVRTIHLRNKESTESRVQKEVAMSNLHQKMRQIEDKRNEVRGKICKLTGTLEKLMGVSPSPSEQQESSHLSVEEPRPRMVTQKGDVIGAASSELPRFMRPTICSRRKSGTSHQIVKDKSSCPARRRKPPLHRAESVSFPIDCRSGCNSESNISRTSCLLNLQDTFGADNKTEYSQDTSDNYTRMAVFTEPGVSPKSLNYLPSHLSFTEEDHDDGTTDEFTSQKISQINQWFHSHEDAQTTNSSTCWNKQVVAIPTPEQRISSKVQLALEHLHDQDFRKEKVKHIKTSSSVDMEITQESMCEADIRVLPVALKEFACIETRPDDTSPCRASNCTLSMELELLKHDRSIGDKKSKEVTTHCQKGPGKLVEHIDAERQHVSAQYSDTDSISYKFTQKCLCDSAMDKAYQMDLVMPGSESLMHNSGIYYHLRNKLQILRDSILLGLGFQSLGFEHDFFFALML